MGRFSSMRMPRTMKPSAYASRATRAASCAGSAYDIYDDGSTMTDTSPQLLDGPRDQQHWEAGHGSGACARVRRKLRVEIVLDDDGTVGR